MREHDEGQRQYVTPKPSDDPGKLNKRKRSLRSAKTE